MKLSLEGIRGSEYAQKGYILPDFDIDKMRENTLRSPKWVHFGAGNIMRAFPAVLCQKLLNSGDADTGISVVECYDEEIIDRAFSAYDDLTVAVSLKKDGGMDKQIVASVAEALGYTRDRLRVEEILCAESLQMLTLTITEKGYAVLGGNGEPLPFCRGDFESVNAPVSIIGKLTRLLHLRYLAGARPLAMVSLDNCSHNGDILKASINTIAAAWRTRGLVDDGFIEYIGDPKRISFTWSMIDKITPRPAQTVIDMLAADGIEDIAVSVTEKNTYVSVMVNAEECEYLAIEDNFPNGRPMLEKVGVIFGSRATVDKIEKMKVCTCLNPLHTCLAIFGCLLGYSKISDEMRDAELRELIRRIGYDEGLPVAVDPGVMSAERFIDEVLNLRLPNPFVPDTPQRIACDTSKKLPVRFGETLKAYIAEGKRDLSFLTYIPLVFAGYARYLMGIDDDGKPFECSPDPNMEALAKHVDGMKLGAAYQSGALRALYSNAEIFGVDLYSCGLGTKAESMFAEMIEGMGAVRGTLRRYLEI